MDRLEEYAARWGIETEYWDGLGRLHRVAPETLSRLLGVLAPGGDGQSHEHNGTPVIHRRAFQAENAPRRMWAIAAQLYGVRSRRNWGHGDFTDLKGLLELAAELGASGVGLNPLHALFDDRPDAYSPYSPSSRLFLNPLYIDPEAIAEFPGADAQLRNSIAALRAAELVDYAGVIAAKSRGLRLAYDAFRRDASPVRKQAFSDFRQRGGALLQRFACFEVLRRRFAASWWDWPREWRTPDDDRLAALRQSEGESAGYFEFLQWSADLQLSGCRARARELGLPIGLYLDIAVGVRPDGFDAWNEQDVYDRTLEIGAPPDRLNLEGQRWGLAGVNPIALEAHDCAPFRRMLHASMQYAGAVRLDHVMGLQRLYLIPDGLRGDQGAYVRFPFERQLAIVGEESVANGCVVIGEDLGTVPENFRATMAEAGIWSYQVMLFQRADDGGFIAADHYRENALVTFSTHDLPTFEGWKAGHDLAVKRALGLDPGETEAARAAALDALSRAMRWRGLHGGDYPSIVAFLAAAPSRLMMVSLEDALNLVEQVNVPGTIAEHPNWRRRLPAFLEDLRGQAGLASLAETLSAHGRDTKRVSNRASE